MSPKFSILFLLIFVGFSYSQHQQKLKQNIKKLLVTEKITGTVWVTVLSKDQIITGASGYKDYKTKVLLNTSHKVQVGSVSKTILATGYLRMATLGLVDLNDPVLKYLPNLPIENRWNNSNPVTIRNLLDHTSGLTDAKLWHIFSTSANPDTPLEKIYCNNPEILSVQTRPGSIYSYSNLGYTILGSIIEKITEQRYETYLDENLLKPLGMTNSTFHFVSQTGNYADKELAYGHFDNGTPVKNIPMYLRPAGQFTTTVQDMGRFLCFLMSDGMVDGKSFVKTKFLKQVGVQQNTDAYKVGVPYGDALGAYTRDRYGSIGIAKNGNTLGFSAMLYIFPSDKKAFFIAQNTDSETANYDLFNEVLAKHLNLTPKKFLKTERITETELSQWEGYYVPVITKVHPFGLLDIIFSHIKIEILKKGAVLTPFQGKKKELIYQGKSLFSMKDRTNVSHGFYKSTENKWFITDGVKTFKKVSLLKILLIASSLLLGIFGLIYVSLHGCVNLIKHKLKYRKHSLFSTFISILFLSISIFLFCNQGFMNIGDKTFPSVLLAISTSLLPLFSLLSIILIATEQKKFFKTLNFWAVIFISQFCSVLIANNIFPIILWK